MKNLYNTKYTESAKNTTFNVKVISKEKISDDYIRYLVKIQDKETGKYIDKLLLNIYFNKYDTTLTENDKEIFLKENQQYTYGDILRVTGKIKKSQMLKNTGEFDYTTYLNSNGIYASISCYTVEKVGNKGNILYRSIYLLKDSINYRIDSMLEKKEANLFKSMIYGDDLNLDEEISNNFKKIGISHLIAVSGSNISVIIYTITFFSSILKLSKKKRILYTISYIIFFNIFTTFEISILRASIMVSFSIILDNFKINIKKYEIMLNTALILLLYNPLYVHNVSFLLSFLATLGIVIYSKTLSSFIYVKGLKVFKIFKNKVLKKALIYIIQIFSMTLSSLILTFPIYILYFKEISMSLFISNILILPIASIFTIISSICIILIFISFFSFVIINSSGFFLKCIIFLSETISNLNIPTFTFRTPNFFNIFSYYFLVILIHGIFFLCRKLKKYKLNISIFKKKIVLNKMECIKIIQNTIVAIVTINFLSSTYYKYFNNYIIFFNIQQGNMCFVRYKGKNIIIDIGSDTDNLAGNTMINFLKHENIYKIDCIFLTHMHSDHINGIFKLIDEIDVKMIAMTNTKLYKNNYEKEINEINKKAKENNIAIIDLEENDEIKLYEDFKVLNLSPQKNTVIFSNDLENTNCNTFYLKVKNTKILFLGDATSETEKVLVNKINNEKLDEFKKIDILQVGHHGSKTSTSRYLLKNISFKEAVISAQKKAHGHPNDETILKLKEYNVNIRITENEGQIMYKIK